MALSSDFYIANWDITPPKQDIQPEGIPSMTKFGAIGQYGAGEPRWEFDVKLLPKDMAARAIQTGTPVFYRGSAGNPDEWIRGLVIKLVGGCEFNGVLQPAYLVAAKTYPETIRPAELVMALN